MTNRIMLALCLFLGGCGAETQAPAGAQDKTAKPLATATPTPTPPPTVQLTVFSETVALYIGGPSGTGHCTQYGGNTYCWDDGLHNAFLFFGAENGLNSCNGACTADTFSAPRWIDSNVQAFITANLPANRDPSQVMSGTGVSVSCTESAGVLACPTFTLDSNQAGL